MVWTELKDTYHLHQVQIYNGGYVIRTSVDDKKMAALYEAVRENEARSTRAATRSTPATCTRPRCSRIPVAARSRPCTPGPATSGRSTTGPARSSPQALREDQLRVEYGGADREQVGSSFKPYVLSAAVKAGMNVQTSTLNGYNNLYIAPDSQPSAYPSRRYRTGRHSAARPAATTSCRTTRGRRTGRTRRRWRWRVDQHRLRRPVAPGGAARAVANMAQEFGVNTAAACITAASTPRMENQAGVALGQASLTVVEQATMLATIANGGVYHSAHVIASIGPNPEQRPADPTSRSPATRCSAPTRRRTRTWPRRFSTRCPRTTRPTAPRR